MKNHVLLFVVAILLAACNVKESPSDMDLPAGGPIQLHPENPHYFLFEGKPLALITSAEHYGAVLNMDFDYEIYLFESLVRRGHELYPDIYRQLF